jgi:hypothetical protein
MLKYGSWAIKGTAGGLKSAPCDDKITVAQLIEIKNLVSCRIRTLGRHIVSLSFDKAGKSWSVRKLNSVKPEQLARSGGKAGKDTWNDKSENGPGQTP